MSSSDFITAINRVSDNGLHLSLNLTSVEKPKLGLFEKIFRAIFPGSYFKGKIQIAENLTSFIERNVKCISENFKSQPELEAFKSKVQTIVNKKLMRSQKDEKIETRLNTALQQLAIPQAARPAPVMEDRQISNGYRISEHTISGLLEDLKKTVPDARRGYNEKIVKDRLIAGLQGHISKTLKRFVDDRHKETTLVVEKCKALIEQVGLPKFDLFAKPEEIFDKMINKEILRQAFQAAGFEITP